MKECEIRCSEDERTASMQANTNSSLNIEGTCVSKNFGDSLHILFKRRDESYKDRDYKGKSSVMF